MQTMPLQLVAVAVMALTLACCVAALPRASSSADPVVASTLFACGGNGDALIGQQEVAALYTALKSVCCEDLHEECDAKNPVPNTCNTVGCARVVEIVEHSCAATFAQDGFLSAAFKPSLDQVVAKCSAAQPGQADHVATYVITDPHWRTAPITTCHGRLVDSATSGFPPDVIGQDAVVIQAATRGTQVRVSVEYQNLPPTANIRVANGLDQSAVELGMVRGTALDTREFVSTKGALRVLRVLDLDDDAGKPLIFSLNIDCVCTDGGKCGEHGTCVKNACECQEGYFGVNCDSEDPCDAVDCGAHGRCIDGTCNCSDGYTGTACQTNPCDAIDCGTHGSCIEGECECTDGYTGTSCEQRRLPCCKGPNNCLATTPCAAVHCFHRFDC